MSTRRFVLAISLFLCSVPAAFAAAETPLPSLDELVIDRITWSGEVAPGQVVVVRNPYGDVRARSAKDAELAVHGVVQRLDTAGEKLAIDVTRRGDVTEVRAVYPPGAEPDPSRLGDRERLDRADVAVHVPAGVRLVLETVDGQIQAKKMKCDVEASTRTGDVSVSTTRSARARSETGRVDVILMDPGFGQPMLVESASGPVSVLVPHEASLTIEVESGGELGIDWEAEVVEVNERKRARVSLGGGAESLRVHSDTGSVEVRQRARMHRVTPAAENEDAATEEGSDG